MIIDESDYLAHYGILRKSGRYPWGSGDDQSTRNRTFLDTIDAMRRDGMSDPDIAKGFDMTTTQLRAVRSIAINEQKQARINEAQKLRDKGMSNSAIGRQMGVNESSVRSLLADGVKDRADVLQQTSKMLKNQVDEKGYIDIGVGVENQLGISNTRLGVAVAVLKEEGYEVHTVQVDQLGTNNKTLIKVLAPPGTTYRDIAGNKDRIRQISEFSDDGGRSYHGIQPPLNVSSKRIKVRYAEEGGTDADGVIYVRPGVDDVSLGASRYAQVRIAVDGTHYLKGMAVYKDDLPDGVDLMFNTNKSKKGSDLNAMKPLNMKDGMPDPDSPFGASVRQKIAIDADGKVRVTSAINMVGLKEGSGEEGGWDSWSKSLSTQMLSKQSPVLAKQQLDLTFQQKRQDLDEILSLTNPAVKKKLLDSYADGADSSAVHLKAHALPRQSTHVILPVNSLKQNEIYAPNFINGERVVLIRYPHGGVFEVPELVVNNRNREAKALLGPQAKDAVGIHHKTAQKLSGADFDGDTVLVIPNNNGRVRTAPVLEGLKNFDGQRSYPEYPGMKVMTARQKGIEMGLVSNLITDMTIKGASPTELARAVRHSMVVIDAEKHRLDFRQSAKDNGIAQLNKKYASGPQGGASTLISRATSEVRIPDRKLRSARDGGPIDPKTGRLVYEDAPKSYVNRQGVTVVQKRGVAKLANTDNAFTLTSEKGTPIETVYAEHSNRLKNLANEARRESVAIKPALQTPSAKTAYIREVQSLQAKLNLARQNKPLERQAQVFANARVKAVRDSNPGLDAAQIKKLKNESLVQARRRTNAQKQQITLTDREWAAIQAGAVSNNVLKQILDNADLDRIKELATPRTATLMTSTKTARAKSMLAAGFTQAEVAQQVGVSLSTLKTSLGE